MRVRLAAVAVLLLGLAACSRAPAPPPPVTVAPPAPDAETMCRQELDRLGVEYQAIDSFGDPDSGCAVPNPVSVTATGVPWNRASVVSCPMALTLSHYQTEVLEPLVESHFGTKLKKIVHAGTYACRIRRNNSTAVAAQTGSMKGGRLSEHAKGQAIDIMALELEDGTVISVKRDWRAGGAKGSFLHALAKQSCGPFNVVLTPNYDRFHQDHIHLDIGPYALCGI